MKTFPTAAIVLIVMGACVAGAGEVIDSKPSQLTPLPTWTGFYAGLNAGSLWNNANAVTTIDWCRLTAPGNFTYSTAFSSAPQTGIPRTNGAAFIGGGQFGYNWQVTDMVVVGVEADFQGVAGAGSNRNASWLGSSSSNKAPSSIGSVRGRAGYLIAPNVQIYGTGGFSYSGGN